MSERKLSAAEGILVSVAIGLLVYFGLALLLLGDR